MVVGEMFSKGGSVCSVSGANRDKDWILLTQICVDVDSLCLEIGKEGNSHQEHGEDHNENGEYELEYETFPVSANDSQSFSECGAEMDPKLGACAILMRYFIEIYLKLVMGVIMFIGNEWIFRRRNIL